MLKDGGKQEIVVDSGAEDRVCPWGWGSKLYGLDSADEWIHFRGANGLDINQYGQRDVVVASTF